MTLTQFENNLGTSSILDSYGVQKIVNHPVHVIENSGELSPSALIPFCEFGGHETMGIKIGQFDVAVCNSFQAKILNDQLCYEVDLNRFVEKDNIDRYLKVGFNFLMDYNEDRQVTFNKDKFEASRKGLANRMVDSNDDQHAHIYINAIGKYVKRYQKLIIDS